MSPIGTFKIISPLLGNPLDLIAGELLQNLKQAEKNILFKFYMYMYETDVIPNDFNVNKTVTIPKKVGSDNCETYRIAEKAFVKLPQLLVSNIDL